MYKNIALFTYYKDELRVGTLYINLIGIIKLFNKKILIQKELNY